MVEIKNIYPNLQIFWVEIEKVKVEKNECPYLREIEKRAIKLWTVEKLLKNGITRAYRDFFWSIGIDPTKERPSSEALIRRILNGKNVPRINCAVDAMNAVSIETLITFGLLDLDKLKSPLTLREAKLGEKMIVIGGREITIPRGFPIIKDAKGIIVSATIYRDGEIAKITANTKNMILIGYGPPGVENAILRAAVKKAKENIISCCRNTY